MPFATLDDTHFFYRLEGTAGAPVLMLSHSIGTDLQMWAPQAADLLPHFQVLRYDTRGHGASDVAPGEYPLERLGRDALALADKLGVAKFAFCGLSLGGATGQWIATNSPDRLTHLVLANTSPHFVPRTRWEERIATVKKSGMASIVDIGMQRFFSPNSLERNPYAAGVRSTLLNTDPVGYLGCCAALRDFDHTQELHKIKTPTLIVSGDNDVSTPWEGHGDILAREIAGSQVVRLPAAHLSNLERPRSFTSALMEFLLPRNNAEDPIEAGFKRRRSVLGDAHVDRSIAAATDLTKDFQDLITGYAWGTIWTRPMLDDRTRRLLTLSMMAAMGRWEEFRLHVRAGLAHGLELCDLKEALLQTAVYAGVPAANTGFHVVQEEVGANK